MTDMPNQAPDGGVVTSFENVEQLHESAANAFCELTRAAVDARGIANVALSGGSTPRRLYEILAEQDLPWSKIHWFWGDERNVTPEDDESNQKMVRQALLDRIGASESCIHAVNVNVEEPAVTAREYEARLREHFAGQAFPVWDLALQGMGDDSHTASLFPGTKALHERDRWFVENWVEKFGRFRYTLTAPAINSARERWFLVSGAGKRNALKNVWTGPRRPDDYPSQLIGPSHWWVTNDVIGE